MEVIVKEGWVLQRRLVGGQSGTAFFGIFQDDIIAWELVGILDRWPGRDRAAIFESPGLAVDSYCAQMEALDNDSFENETFFRSLVRIGNVLIYRWHWNDSVKFEEMPWFEIRAIPVFPGYLEHFKD